MILTLKDGWIESVDSARADFFSSPDDLSVGDETYSLQVGRILGPMCAGVQGAGWQDLVGAVPTFGTMLLQ